MFCWGAVDTDLRHVCFVLVVILASTQSFFQEANYLSDMGGILGVCLSCSFISFVEFVEFFVSLISVRCGFKPWAGSRK